MGDEHRETLATDAGTLRLIFFTGRDDDGKVT